MLEFLNLFWGDTVGFYCIAEKTPKGMVHRYFQTPQEAHDFLRPHIESPTTNLYFSPSIYKTAKRNQENVKLIKSFWIDIDCGEDKPYKTKEEGLSALDGFLAQTSLPRPNIVDSGHGYHIYWILKSPLEPKEWLPMANKLKSMCILNGFRVDPSRTADSSSLMRPVGTYNLKTGEMEQVLLIKSTKSYTLEDLKVIHELPKDNEPAVVMQPDFPDAFISDILGKCPAMKSVADVNGAVEEPLWRAFLSVAFRCDQGARWIHDLSKGDPRYSFKETQEKAEKTKGPYTCEQFAAMCPEHCVNCPFKGKVNSPIVLGFPKKVAIPPIIADEHKMETAERITEIEEYTVTDKGVLKRATDDRSGTSQCFYITHIPVWVKTVKEKARRYDEQGDSSVILEWVALGGRYQSSVLPQAVLYEKRTFVRWLAENNLRACIKGDPANLQDYISKCILQLMRVNCVERYYESLGWHDDGFVLGRNIVSSTGVAAASIQASGMFSKLEPKGSKALWVETTSLYENPRYWQHAFALLCSFGSPILDMCHFQSAVISLFGASGFGKTLASSFALSIYGEPSLLMQAASATPNAIGKQLTGHKNVPYLLDEVSGMSITKLADFIYDAANGRQKDVLSKDRQLVQGEGWCLVPFITSNNSVLEQNTSIIQEAHRRRVVEIAFDEPIDQKDAAQIAEAFQENYGTVASDYLTYLIQNKDKVRKLVDSVLDTATFKAIPSINRFGKWTIACAFVGGLIAKELGLMLFDPKPVIEQAITVYLRESMAVAADVELAKDALTAFLMDNYQSINFWNEGSDVSLSSPRQIMARYDSTRDMYIMQKSKYAGVVRDAGLSIRNLHTWHKAAGVFESIEKLSKQTPTTICYCVPSSALGVVSLPNELATNTVGSY